MVCTGSHLACAVNVSGHRNVNARLPGKENSNTHGAGPVHLTITMIKWIQTSKSSIKNSLPQAYGSAESLSQAYRGTSTIRAVSSQDPTVGLWLGPYDGPRGGRIFLRARYPCMDVGEC